MHWIEHAPQWWVMRQVHSHNAKARDQAIAEAARRDAKGMLSHAREALLVQEALAHQSDWAYAWNPGWGDLVETARAGRRVSDTQWEQYLLDAVTVKLTTDPLERSCDAIYIDIERGPDRGGSGPHPPWPVGLHLYLYGHDMRIGKHLERIECQDGNRAAEFPPHLSDQVTDISILDSVQPGTTVDFMGMDRDVQRSLALGRQTLTANLSMRPVRGGGPIAGPANRDFTLLILMARNVSRLRRRVTLPLDEPRGEGREQHSRRGSP